MRSIFLCLLTLCALTSLGQSNLPSAEPESKGFSSEKLAELANHLETSGSHAMMILVDGEVIFDWGATDQKLLIHSIRKSMLNSLYGMAVAEGKIDTSATLADLDLHDIAPDLTDAERTARVADLLRSRSGVYHDAAAVHGGMLRDRPERGTYGPGEHYYYNNWDFNALGYIIEEAYGTSLFDLYTERVARPLGMQDYEGQWTRIDGEADSLIIPDTDAFYQLEQSRSNFPAYHFRMSARDMALYGLLYLNYGEWNGEQIVPRSWIDASTQPYSIYSPKYGSAYGMLWRVRVPGAETIRNSFFHTGLGVHMLGVYPDLNMVIVHRVNTEVETDYSEGSFYRMIAYVFNSRITD
ncbi:serine hydrolase [Cryomorphaceae bacterium]|nr:serine hydrolase [Cryomorphaceae bacterium]